MTVHVAKWNDRADPERNALIAERALPTTRTARKADQCAEINQSEGNNAGCAARDDTPQQLPKPLIFPRARLTRLDSETPSENTNHIRVKQRLSLTERNQQHSIGDISPHTREGKESLWRLRDDSVEVRDQRTAKSWETCAPMKQAEWAENIYDVFGGRGSQRLGSRVTVDEPLIHLRHQVGTSALQQQLRDQDMERIPRLAPAKASSMVRVPLTDPPSQPPNLTVLQAQLAVDVAHPAHSSLRNALRPIVPIGLSR